MATVKGNSSTTITITRVATSGAKTVTSVVAPSRSQNWASADADNSIEEVYQAVYTAQAAAQTIDLTSLTDDDGVAFAFAAVKEIYVEHTDTADTLTVGAAASNAFIGWGLGAAGSTAILPPATSAGAAAFHWVCPSSGVAVSGTNKNILMTPSAAMDWKIIIAGTRV